MSIKNNYPFVPIQIANLAKKYGFDGPCFGVYEKGYSNNGKKISEKLLRVDVSTITNNAIEFITKSEHYKEYLQRPGMFVDSTVPAWCVKAPTYDQLIDWLNAKYQLYVNISWYYRERWQYYILDRHSFKINEGECFDSKEQVIKVAMVAAFDYLKKCKGNIYALDK